MYNDQVSSKLFAMEIAKEEAGMALKHQTTIPAFD